MRKFEVNYSSIDRMLHSLAMSQIEMQKSLSRIEDRGFNKIHVDITAAEPVFITSLPRAGTTLLLNLISGTPVFASHTYRDMPFLLCPLTWDRVSHRFHKQAEARERAHGDGMLVSYDSPEAFEEILWRAFWSEHYESIRIRPWAPDDEDEGGEFATFLRQHMRKIIDLGRKRSMSVLPQRYVSKNNANIARLEWLEKYFPDATILIPYREPFAHITSLASQHAKFLKEHANDKFVLRYMETIGHLEFGKAIRPIDFDNWLASASDLDPTTLNYWAQYWIVAFRTVLRTAGPCSVVFSYDRLCAAPAKGLEALEERIGVEAHTLTKSASSIRSPTTYKPAMKWIAQERQWQLQELFAQLNERALF